MSFYVQLQRVCTGIVFGKQGLADFWYPFGCSSTFVLVNGFACPQRDVVQVDQAGIRTAIDQCSQLAVANGQRLFEILGWLVIP